MARALGSPMIPASGCRYWPDRAEPTDTRDGSGYNRAISIEDQRSSSTPVCCSIFFLISPLASAFRRSRLKPPACLAPAFVSRQMAGSRMVSRKSWPAQVI